MHEQDITVAALFDLTDSLLGAQLAGCTYPWQALPHIGEWLLTLGPTLPAEEFDNPAPQVWVARSARVAPSAAITGPCIIMPQAEVRHCAFIRGNAFVGSGAVVGNSTELKNCILLDGAQVPHYNYVGDSILGKKAHMGAGAVTSNLKSDHGPVGIRLGDMRLETGLRKVGAFLGDGVEVGCHCVLNPGSVVGAGSRIYPLTALRGCVPAGHIVKNMEQIVPII